MIKRIAKKLPVFVSSGNAHLLGCGSILETANDKSFIWGSGFIKRDSVCPRLSEGSVKAVRGRLTLDRLRKRFDWITELPLGDPGSLLPREYPRDKDARYRFGVLAHYVDRNHPFLTYSRERGALIIDVQQDVTDVLDEMFLCENILSSSLHGLILSDAYGIRNRWIKLGNNLIGNDYKFHDYYSTRTSSQKLPHIIDSGVDLGKIIQSCSLTTERYDLEQLYGAFPKDAPCIKTNRNVLDCSTLKRQRSLPTPVFLTAKNSKKGLEGLLKARPSLDDSFQFFMQDIGSSDRYILDLLERINEERVIVTILKVDKSIPRPISLQQSIESRMRCYSEPVPYLVADIDTVSSEALKDFLTVSQDLLRYHYEVDSVIYARRSFFSSCLGFCRRLLGKLPLFPGQRWHVQNYSQDGLYAQYTKSVPSAFSFAFNRAESYNRFKNPQARAVLSVLSLSKTGIH